MLKKILIAVAALIVIVVVVGLVLPKGYRLSHSVVIAAEPAKVHALVSDLKEWPKWEPFTETDKTIVTTIGPKSSGVGASQSWTGESGGGRFTFTKCDPKEGIAYDLVFVDDGREMPAKSWMTYAPKSGGVEVTWGMEGTMDVPVIGGYFAMLSNSMIGPMFDNGLAKLKKVAEAN
jgi:hypothetical protein